MNNIEILEEFIEHYKEVQEKYKDDEIQAEIERSCYFEEVPAEAIENLIKENKELKEKIDVMRRKIYRLEEDNMELLKPKGKDQLNYKYIECPKVEAEWYKSESYIKENYIPKSKVKEHIQKLAESKVFPITITKQMLQELLEN